MIKFINAKNEEKGSAKSEGQKLYIYGDIVGTDWDKWTRDETCPQDVLDTFAGFDKSTPVDVYINSGGGVIDVGSEIYTLLRDAANTCNVEIYITGEACSAASVIACAAHSTMAPTALMMVHCVSSGICGNHSDMEHMAEVLRTADRAMCTAYTAKTGMTEQEALDMMEQETWLTAQQAKDKGLVDEIMFEEPAEELPMTASAGLFKLPTKEQMDKARAMMNVREEPVEEQPAPNDLDAVRRARECDYLMMSQR